MERTMTFDRVQMKQFLSIPENKLASLEGLKEYNDEYRKALASMYMELEKANKAIEDQSLEVSFVVAMFNTTLAKNNITDFKAAKAEDGDSVVLMPTSKGRFSYENFCKHFKLDSSATAVMLFYGYIVNGRCNGLIFEILSFVRRAIEVKALSINLTEKEVEVLTKGTYL